MVAHLSPNAPPSDNGKRSPEAEGMTSAVVAAQGKMREAEVWLDRLREQHISVEQERDHLARECDALEARRDTLLSPARAHAGGASDTPHAGDAEARMAAAEDKMAAMEVLVQQTMLRELEVTDD